MSHGHEVTFVTNPFHEKTVRDAGLDYRASGDHVDLYALITNDPELLTSPRALQVLAHDLAKPHFIATYHRVSELLRRERPDAVVGSNLEMGLFWAALERGVPAAMIAATPLGWFGGHAPTQFLDVEIPERWLPFVLDAVRAIGMLLIDQTVRSIARNAGAGVFDPSYSAIEKNVALHAGMWPTLMRPSSPGDLPNMRICGYTSAGHLGTAMPALSPELEAFLAAGKPPVVIALGSIFSLSSHALIADAAHACADLGQRCVVVGRPPRERPLPDGTLVVPYATYQRLFPRAAAIVIHGGAGTTGEALKSGRPCVVVPEAFDQFGIAWQVARLGAGVRVARRGRSRETIGAALRSVIEDESFSTRATAVANELNEAPDGAEAVARLVTELR